MVRTRSMSQDAVEAGEEKVHAHPQETNFQTKHTILILVCLIAVSAFGLYTFWSQLPPLTAEEQTAIKLPRSIEDVKTLRLVLAKYTETNFAEVIFGVGMTYLILQTFAVPGSIFLNILAGALFGVPVAFCLVNCVSTAGASCCYFLSHFIGRGLVRRTFPGMLASFHKRLSEHRDDLFNYILFLRISPILPNWFINISSPVMSVPYKTFFAATFLGLMPANFIGVKAGVTLSELNSAGEAVPWQALVSLLLLAFVALIPVMLKKRLAKKFGQS